MARHIKIHIDFDITNTGVIRNYRDNPLPAKVNGMMIKSKEEWIKLRRQQANWETFIQIISLRIQPLNIQTTVNKNSWTLEFDVDNVDALTKDDDPIGLLKADLENIPLLTGLDEKKNLELAEARSYRTNVRFETYEI